MGTVTGSAGTTPINPGACGGTRPSNCDFTVSPLTIAAPAAGGSFSTQVVEARRECTWTAESRATWITQRSPSPGVEACGAPSTPASFDVAPNTSTASRVGILRVAGKDVQVEQAGATPSCEYRLVNSREVSITSSGGTGSVSWTLVSGTGCSWTARVPSEFPWITTQDTSGTGNITVRFTVAANTGGARTGRIEVRWPGPQQGENILITQAARVQ